MVNKSRRVALVMAALFALAACSTTPEIPTPHEFAQGDSANLYRFAPGIDPDDALRIMASYPEAYEQYERSRLKCESMDASDSETEQARCQRAPDCELTIAFGDHGMGGPTVCVTNNPLSHPWSQERKRRACFRASHGVWGIYQLTDTGEVYGDCEGG